MRSLAAVMLLLGLVLTTAAVVTSADAAPPSPPATVQQPPLPVLGQLSGQVSASSCPCIGWSVYFGRLNGVHPVVSSARSPSWVVYAGPFHLTFQSDCNLVSYNGWADWATNTVAGLRPCVLDFQLNLDIQIRNAASQVGWRTGVVHSGNTYGALAYYDNGCLVEYYWNAPTSQWLNQWSSNIGGRNCNTLRG